MRIHGTAISYADKGVLIRGESGAGKSTLAAWLLRSAKLHGLNCSLVADDIVILEKANNTLVASAPDSTAGLMELRGFGPIKMNFLPSAALHCIIDIVAADTVERLPDDSELEVEIAGIRLRRQLVPDNSFVRMTLLAENAISDTVRIC